MPPNSFDAELAIQVEQLAAQGLRRELRRIDSPQSTRLTIDGRQVLNFSSNDYLGLADHPDLKESAAAAVRQFGAGAGAARLLCGSLAPFHDLEAALANFKGTEAALTFSSGYATALGTIAALLGPDDVMIVDKLVHACVVDAARLSGAKLRAFRHNDLNDLEAKLKWAGSRGTSAPKSPSSKPRVLVVTESVFSMDGDLAPLREIVELKDRHGAWLMLDEAHATGLFGERRCGLAEAFGLANRVEIQMGTLGKALGAAGGYICGSRSLVDLLIHRARSFVFSTAPVPAAAAAARAAVELVRSPEGEILRQRLWQRVDETKNAIINAGWSISPAQSPILPLRMGGETRAVEVATALRDRGLYIPAIRYPTVARGQARLRVTVSATHTSEDVRQLQAALTECAPPPSKSGAAG